MGSVSIRYPGLLPQHLALLSPHLVAHKASAVSLQAVPTILYAFGLSTLDHNHTRKKVHLWQATPTGLEMLRGVPLVSLQNQFRYFLEVWNTLFPYLANPIPSTSEVLHRICIPRQNCPYLDIHPLIQRMVLQRIEIRFCSLARILVPIRKRACRIAR